MIYYGKNAKVQKCKNVLILSIEDHENYKFSSKSDFDVKINKIECMPKTYPTNRDCDPQYARKNSLKNVLLFTINTISYFKKINN